MFLTLTTFQAFQLFCQNEICHSREKNENKNKMMFYLTKTFSDTLNHLLVN